MAGIGLTAKAVDAGGADLIIVYNSGRYRMNGLGSLAGLMPYGNANDIVLEMVRLDLVTVYLAFDSRIFCLWVVFVRDFFFLYIRSCTSIRLALSPLPIKLDLCIFLVL